MTSDGSPLERPEPTGDRPTFVKPGGAALVPPGPGLDPSVGPDTAAEPGSASEPGSTDERRLHPAATAIDAIRHARGAAAGMLVVIVSQGLAIGGAIVGALLLIAAATALLQWRTTRYAVIDGTLRLRTGVFSRKERNIPASRISALDTSRGVLQRMFGVVALQVQTAGGGKEAEISLRAVSFAEAERLRGALGHREVLSAAVGHGTGAAAGADTTAAWAFDGHQTDRPAPASPHASREPATVVYAITPRQLVVAALTSPSIAVVGAAVAAAFSLGSDALPDSAQRQLEDAVTGLTVAGAVMLVGVGIVIAAIVSVAGSILLYGGFQVTRDERRLRVRRGLLTERVGTIPIDRIHGVRVIESPLRQALGYAAIEVEVAGYADQDEVTRTLVPLVRRDAIPALLAAIVPAIAWPGAELEPVPVRGRRRYLTAPLLTSVPFAIATALAPIGALRGLTVAFPLMALWLGRRRARDAGWLLAGETLVLRWRGVSRVTVLAESRRLQRTQGSTSVFQRRADLGTFAIRMSNARGARVRHLDSAVVHELLLRTGR